MTTLSFNCNYFFMVLLHWLFLRFCFIDYLEGFASLIIWKVLLPTGWKRKWFPAEARHHYLSPMMEVNTVVNNIPTIVIIVIAIVVIIKVAIITITMLQVVKGIKALEEVVRLGPEYTHEERERVFELGRREAAFWIKMFAFCCKSSNKRFVEEISDTKIMRNILVIRLEPNM